MAWELLQDLSSRVTRTWLDFALKSPLKSRYQVHLERIDIREEIRVHCSARLACVRIQAPRCDIPSTWYGSRKPNVSSYWCMSLRYFLERLALIVNVSAQGMRWSRGVAAVLCCWDETFFVLPGGGTGGDGLCGGSIRCTPVLRRA